MSIHLQSLSQPHVSPYSYYSPNVTNLYCIHEFNQACLFISPTPITHSGLIPRCKDGLKKKWLSSGYMLKREPVECGDINWM